MGIPAPAGLHIFIDGRFGDDFIWYFRGGESMPYLNWAPDQPNNYEWQTYGNQTYLALNPGDEYRMNDYWNVCHEQDVIWYLCEF